MLAAWIHQLLVVAKEIQKNCRGAVHTIFADFHDVMRQIDGT